MAWGEHIHLESLFFLVEVLVSHFTEFEAMCKIFFVCWQCSCGSWPWAGRYAWRTASPASWDFVIPRERPSVSGMASNLAEVSQMHPILSNQVTPKNMNQFDPKQNSALCERVSQSKNTSLLKLPDRQTVKLVWEFRSGAIRLAVVSAFGAKPRWVSWISFQLSSLPENILRRICMLRAGHFALAWSRTRGLPHLSDYSV